MTVNTAWGVPLSLSEKGKRHLSIQPSICLPIIPPKGLNESTPILYEFEKFEFEKTSQMFELLN